MTFGILFSSLTLPLKSITFLIEPEGPDITLGGLTPRRGWEVPETTPEDVYMNRRRLTKAVGNGAT